MATLLVKFTDERQYDAVTARIIYADPTTNRWNNVFSKLVLGDNCIFHSSNNKLYVGEFTSSVPNVSVTFSKIRVADIKLDKVLRINALTPETLSEFKRPNGPILKENTIDVNLIYNAAVHSSFISFYVVKLGSEDLLLPSLIEGDRVITVDDNRIINLYKKENGTLAILNLGNDYFKASGKSLPELKEIMTDLEKPHHIATIQRIEQGLANSNFYKFPSFTAYYNVMHNRGVFSQIPTSGGGSTNTIDDNINNMPFNMPLNTILYGPPGTGKTFHSITHAVAIVDDKNPDELIEASKTEAGRKAIKDRYDFLFEAGHIAFTTFHQSLSYEDFIEGIKPLKPTPGQTMLYDIVDGIFKKICDKAEECVSANIIQRSSFEDALEQLEADWRVNPNMSFELTRDNKSFTINEFKSKNIPFKKASGGTPQSLSKKTLSDLYLGTRKSFPSSLEIYYKSVLDKLKSYTPLVPEGINKSDSKPCKVVLIVDEINRGNVSQIFGELITLLEPDKRIGEKEEIRLMLPYSKKKFGVPSNVYIIGTMNTADRSVEALDTALRRRFSFIPMMPDYSGLSEACDGVNLKLLLQKLNERLTVLKDRDHTIGHAWLWNTTSIDSLRLAFKDKIIPLLQEFFYNDYEKLGLLLGDRFIQTEITVNNNLFAPFERGSGLKNQYANKAIFKITEPSSWNSEAFQSIYL
ncbi:MAG: hypothetical protein RL737_386 [Bacteroidota bacterium]|jgi:5-methylcytosine-specific restriction protein B